MKKVAVVIPARYQSARFPGKPLHLIAGKSMLERVYEIAMHVCAHDQSISVLIATENEQIKQHASRFGAEVVMTSEKCKTGSDRCLAACQQLSSEPDFVINLQGDVPLMPPVCLSKLLDVLLSHDTLDVVTPFVRLTWEGLDELRKAKKDTPFSGTSVIKNSNDEAIWFSKNIIPAIRDEQSLRKTDKHSPVLRHIGMYGYTMRALKKFVGYPETAYEKFEGLEQLRILENGLKIKLVEIDHTDFPAMSGIDTLQDANRAEALINSYGEVVK